MDNNDNRRDYILVLLPTIIFTFIYLIYLYIISKYIIRFYKTKKLSIFWISYLITFVLYILFLIVYLSYLFVSKGEIMIFFNPENYPSFIILLSSILVANLFNIINNLVYNSFSSLKIIISLNKIIKINNQHFQDLFFRLKDINSNFFEKKTLSRFYIIFGIIDVLLIVAFALEYNNYNDENTNSFLLVKNFIFYVLKLGYFICLISFFIFIFLLNIFKKRYLKKIYYNTELFSMKIYNFLYNKILFSSDIISIKILLDLIINFPILVILLFKIDNTLLWIISEIFTFFYILIFGALILKIDKINEIGKIPKVIKTWFFLKDINFCFCDYYQNYYLNDITYKYSKEEKQMLKSLKLIVDETEEIVKKESINIKINDNWKLSLVEEKIINMDKFSIRQTQTQSQIITDKVLKFNTISEIYVLYKLLMLYFEKNEYVYSKVQNKINEDGTPFKQFFTHQNLTKNKKKKARQTFGGNDGLSKQKEFISNIDRISRISKFNSNNIIRSMQFKESKIFYSLEEKELREEFRVKFNNEKEIEFKIESLEPNSFFELFPFFQISIQDIINSLYPSNNKKIIEILLKQKQENLNKNNIESESENNLFHTYNSLLMLEIYDLEDFISSFDLSNFSLSYGTYITDIIKNINFTFLPLIIGIFNIEICEENKIVVLYRNPLYFTNFNHYNHWINFFITEGPEKIKASIFQNEIIDINEIEIKNSLKMNEADYEEITNNLKRDFDFFTKMKFQVYPIIHLFIGDEKDEDIGNNIDVDESSLIENVSFHQTNLSGLLNITDDGSINNKIFKGNRKSDSIYKTDSNSLIDKEYYSINGHDVHTIKIYFTHFFRLNCELNKHKNSEDSIILKSNHYCQYLEGQIQTYLTKTTLFGIENIDNN